MSNIMPIGEAGGPHLNRAQENGPDLTNLLTDAGLSPEDAAAAQKAYEDDQAQKRASTFDALANTVEAKLSNRMGWRKNKENQWLEALRIFLGSLSSYNTITPDNPFGSANSLANGESRTNGVHRPEFNIIRQKCNIAIAQVQAFQFAAGDKNWDIRPPQTVEIDQDDYQQVQQAMQAPMSPEDAQAYKAQLMERQMEDDLSATNYANEIRKAQVDWVVLGTGIMKRPTTAGKLKKIYVKSQTSDGRTIRIPKTTVETKPCVYRVNPWYFFPDDTVTELDKGSDAIEVHPYYKQQLADLAKHPGYFADQINLCLAEDPRTYVNSPFNDPAYLTQGINLLKDKYLLIEYHGPIKKTDLDLLGVVYDADLDPMDELYGEIWVVNSRVIRLELSQIEGCHRHPYDACVWESDPATPFGFGVPMLARDQQRVVNETYKMLLDNAGVSAGPQVVVDTTIIQPQEGGNEVTPFKVWLAKEFGADMTKAIQFFMPPNAYEGLAALIDKARSFADEESCINLIAAGGGTPAQGMDNATGMALINQNAMTPLFFKAEQWDDSITHPLITSVYDWEMQYNPNDLIKGAYCIDVRSSTAYLKETMERRDLERLSQEIAQGSPIAEWVNMDELMQIRLAAMKLPYQNIIKTPQQIAQERQQKAQQPPQPDPNMLKAQAAMEAVEVSKQKLALDSNRLQFDQQSHQETLGIQAQIQHDTNMSNIQERQLDVQRAHIEAAGKHGDAAAEEAKNRATMETTLATTAMQEHTKRQQLGISHAQHLDKVTLEQKKIDSAERQAQQANDVQLKGIRVNAEAKAQQQANRKLDKHNPSPK